MNPLPEYSERNGQNSDPSTQDSAVLSPVKRALQEVRELRTQLTEAREAASGRQSGPVAIVGVGLRFPGGVIDATSFWDLLANGKDAITDIPRERWDYRQYFDSDAETRGAMYAIRGGFLEGIDLFDADFFGIAPREAVMLDPQQRLLHEVAWHALEDAALRPDRLRGSRTGIFLGMSNFDYSRLALRDDLRIDAYTGSGNSPSMAAGRLAYTLGVHGPAVTVDTSCSSSLMAVHLASQSLRAGECDLALAGGVNVILAPQMHIGFSRAHMLAPDGRCKTFDEAADGYVRSEGCAVVILKRLQEAVKDGDRILAVVRGSATNHDGRSGGLTAPSSQAQTALIREAFNNAGVMVNEIGMIEAHGTGTSLGDPIEMDALGEVFRHRAANLSPVPVGSVKTNLGHTEAASGMAGLLKAAFSLDRKQIPRHLHLIRKSGFIPWDQLPLRVPTEHSKWELEANQRRRIAGISSFGFSGSNAHVVLEEFVPEDRIPSASASSGPHVAVVSGRTAEALSAAQKALFHHLRNDDESTLTDLCQTLSRGRMHHAHRRAFVVNTRAEFEGHLRSEISQPGDAASTKGFEHSLCFLFTGQGSEHSGMGLELYERNRIFRTTVDQLDRALEGGLGKRIRQIWANKAGELERASLLQPALYAFGWSLSELWRSWGVAPRVVLGHSLGEYIAATVAGVMNPEQAIRLVAARGRLLEELAEPGGMVAVVASKQLIEDFLLALSFGRELSVAAVNGPASIVVSGPTDAIGQFEEHLIHRQMRHRRLRTTHGFHSAALDRMLDAFEGEAARVEYKIPEVSWISNVTGKPVQREHPVDSGYWRQHLRNGVEFAQGLKASAAVASTFIELGAEPQLLALAEANEIARDRLIPSISKDANSGEWQKLLTAASRLYTSGVDVDWDAVADHGAYRKLALPGYPFQRRHYWCSDAAGVNENACVRMAEAANDQAVMVPIQLDVAGLAERQDAVNRWATAHIFATLLELGCFGRDGDSLTAADLIEKHHVVPAHRRLMERWLLRLAQEGMLQATNAENTAFATVPGVTPTEPASLWLDVKRLLAGDEPLRNYLAQCSAGLMRVLRGELSPIETLFPRGDGELAKALYERSPAAVYVNRIASAAVAARSRLSTRTALGFPRRLRILEVGAGTGSTTAAILAQLAPESVLYTFSDVSEIFLNRARQRFRNFPMTFTLFDLDCAEHASRHEGRYDLVIVANALHAAKDLRTSLKHIRQVLQPGGSVVLVETTAAQAWHDVSTGLMEGWQHHSDQVRSDRSPLLSVDCWAKEFGQGGWDHFAAVPGPQHATHQLGLHVLVAQKPVEAQASEKSVTENYFPDRSSMASVVFRDENLHSVSAGNGAGIVPGSSTTLVEEIAAALPRQRVILATEATTSSVAQVLGRSACPMKEDRLMDIGLDSLMAIELRDRLQTIFGLDQLSSTLIFDYPTSEAIAHVLLGRLGYQEDGRPVDHSLSEPEATFLKPTVHSDEELDAMSEDEIAELLRMQLES